MNISIKQQTQFSQRYQQSKEVFNMLYLKRIIFSIILFMLTSQNQQAESKVRIAIQLISQKPRYQWRLLIFLCIYLHILGYSVFSQSILFVNPQFKCEGSQDTIIKESEACEILDFCTIQNTYSLTARLHLYCGRRQDERNLIQSLFGFGCIVGVLVVNWVANTKGKKFGIIMAMCIATMHSYCLLLGSSNQDANLIIMSQFLTGFALSCSSSLSFLLFQKFIAEGYMKYALPIFFICLHGLGQIGVAIYNQIFASWQIYTVITTIPYTILTFTAFFILKEDPVYLYNNHRIQQLEELIREIASINNSSFIQTEEAVDSLYRLSRRTTKESLSLSRNDRDSNSLLFSFQMLTTIFILAGCSLAHNTVYYGSEFEIASVGFTANLNLIGLGLIQIINYTLIIYLTSSFPSNKIMIIVTAIATGLLSLVFATSFCKNSPLLQLVFLVMIRFFGNTYGICYINYYVENLPKKVESSAAGLIQGLGCTGKIIAPLGVRFSNNFNMSPLVFFGIIQLTIGLLPTFFLKEDKKKGQTASKYNLNEQIFAK